MSRIWSLILWFCVLSLECYALPTADYRIEERENKKGLVDVDGTVLIPFEYDDLGWSDGEGTVRGELIGFKLEGKWGLVNLENQRITGAMYASLDPWLEDRFIVSRTGIYSNKPFFGVINSKGKAIVGFKYYSVEPRGDLLVVGLETSDRFRFGIVDKDNNPVMPAEYLDIHFISPDHLAVTNPYRKIGIFELSGRKLSEFELDSILEFQEEYALVYRDGQVGVLNRQGEIVVPVQYKQLEIKPNPGFKALKYDKWSFVDVENQEISHVHCDSIFPLRDNLYQIELGEAEAIMNHEISKFHFGRWQMWYHEPTVIVIKNDGKFGVIDEFGNTILETVYDSIRYDQGYLYTLKNAGSEKGWTIRNSFGQKITTFRYQEVGNLVERRLRVKRKDHWGYLNPVGKEVIPCKFAQAQDFDEGLAMVDYLDGLGVIDRNGRWLVHPYQQEIDTGPPGLYITREYFRSFIFDHSGDTIYQTYNRLEGHPWGILEKDQEKMGLLNRYGRRILDPVYDRIKPVLKDSVFAVWTEESGFIINLLGRRMMEFNRPYEDILFLDDEFMGVQLDSKFGLIDLDGKLRIANRYEGIRPSEEGMVPVKLLGKWGFVDSDEVLVVQPRYDSVGHYRDGLALITRQGMNGLIDQNGKELFGAEFDQMHFLENGNYLLRKNGKWGLVNSLGHTLAHYDFDTVEELSNGNVIVSRKKKWGLISSEGSTLIPQMYDDLRYDPYRDIYLARTAANWTPVENP